MKKYIDSGHARVVPDHEVIATINDMWFLPHHPVTHPDKPQKLRIVFDCAASHKGNSLNSHLFTGPDITSTLIGVLLRFRRSRIAIAGDIEGMFHQIKMKSEDSKRLSFLWWDMGEVQSEPVVHQMTVHLFGSSSSPCCANYELRRTATDFGKFYDDLTIETVKRSFYVDDCLVSVDDVRTAIELRQNLTNMLKQGGFKLTKWMSSCPDVLKTIPIDDLATSVSTLNMEFSELPIERALGIAWNTSRDTFSYKVKFKSKPQTKRGILSAISSVYDPFGIVSPYVLTGKLLLQDITRRKLGWDEDVEREYADAWKTWLEQLPSISKVSIPRCIKPQSFGKVVHIQLHTFSDASLYAYGASSYIRLQDINDRVHVAFLMGKSRLAPVKSVTIPRLELSAAVVAVKLSGLISRELDLVVDQTYHWTDSTTVLQYLKNADRRFKTFVANRISLICNASSLNAWKHVPGGLNPADDASRGLKAIDITPNCRWLNGPDFLRLPEAEWPKPPKIAPLSEMDPEVRQNVVVMATAAPVDCIVEFIRRYSSLNRLLKAVAWVLRFKLFIKSSKTVTFPSAQITADEMTHALKIIISFMQHHLLPDVYQALRSRQDRGVSSHRRDKSVQKRIRKLHPMLDDGLLRVGGRLSNAPIGYESKHPILLPKCHLSDLIIQHIHDTNGHVGSSHTWSILRQQYWVISGSVQIRKIIGKCLQCCKRNSKLSSQIMADLPAARVTSNRPPFHATGVDFFGPLFIKQSRSVLKRYGCLFTCMSSRAVHLEVANDLSSSSFINAFRRFVNRRGLPLEVFSDNGTNFTGAEKELLTAFRELNKEDVSKYMVNRKIRWHFNPPRSPHTGGVWERLVRMVKDVLKVILNNQLVNDEVLHTLLTEAESILNSRPLIPISFDPSSNEPLTPNHVLLFRPSAYATPGTFERRDNYSKRRWRQVQYLADQFWRRWCREYLPLLHFYVLNGCQR